MRFRSLQSRILVFFLGLFTIVQLVTVASIVTANWRWVNQQVHADLHAAKRILQRLVEERVEQLALSTKLLSGDFAFKQAYANGDHETLMSAVRNLQEHRIGADVMMVADATTYTLVANTLHPELQGDPAPFQWLIERAENSGKPATSMGSIDGRLYELVVVPLLAPEPIAWITVGFRIDDRFARNLQDFIHTHITFLSHGSEGDASVVASTLPEPTRRELATYGERPSAETGRVTLDGEQFIASRIALGREASVVLQRSLDKAFAPFQRLYRLLLVVALVSLALTTAGGILIARTVTRPVKVLADRARRIGEGDYDQPVRLARDDEIGQLANAFDHMITGLRAFQRYLPTNLVRTLVSKGIESQPQARVATVLFADIEDFTNVADSMSPDGIVTMLNGYFEAVSRPIEKYHGVILQYQGDAVLAAFNVPEDDPDHATHAVKAALEIQEVLAQRRSVPGDVLRTRIGINTGEVVAATVGSESRVAYTVHGEAVNLAARLEVLNKKYGTRIMISGATAEHIGDEFGCAALGEVRLRGSRRKVSVYTVTSSHAEGHNQALNNHRA